MATTTITLPDDQLARLQQHAETSQRSLDEVVREAVNAYLARLPETNGMRVLDPPTPRWTPPERRRGADGMLIPIPHAMTPDEIDRLLAQPSSEARREYMADWLTQGGPRILHEPPGSPAPEWQAEVEAALANIRARVPPDMTSEEIEQLITDVSEEARQERIARPERGLA